MRKTRLFSLLAVVLAVAMLGSVCAFAAGEDAEEVTITYANFNASGGNEETLQKMYEAFHEEYPNITVQIETIASADYFTTMQTRVAGGTAPDCYELNIENFAAYANNGALEEITGVDLSGLDETALSAFTVDGKQYGLPGNFSKKQGPDEVQNRQNDLDREDAARRRLCVTMPDGSPYVIPEGNWFSGSMAPDFTNPETAASWFSKRRYLLDMGVDGFKTDGGEFIHSPEARFSDGSDGRGGVNRYARDYTERYRDFVGPERVIFSRAGYAGQHTVPIHWAGDQQSQNGELRSVLRAGLSAAATGILFWGFDLAGFAGPLPSLDLYRRATQMACFCPVMQWHSEPDGGQFRELMPGGEGNNERSPWNMAGAYAAPAFLDEMRCWHKLREALRPYLWEQARRCAAESRPMLRPLAYEWPEDKNAVLCDDEYMLGDELLAAPLLEENALSRAVYLPAGRWEDYFTGQEFEGPALIDSTPDGRIPVFVKLP